MSGQTYLQVQARLHDKVSVGFKFGERESRQVAAALVKDPDSATRIYQGIVQPQGYEAPPSFLSFEDSLLYYKSPKPSDKDPIIVLVNLFCGRADLAFVNSEGTNTRTCIDIFGNVIAKVTGRDVTGPGLNARGEPADRQLLQKLIAFSFNAMSSQIIAIEKTRMMANVARRRVVTEIARPVCKLGAIR